MNMNNKEVPSLVTTVWVKFQKEGIHCYPAAINIPGVEFLASPHRHMFHFRVELEVFHDDREIEFILLKRELESLYDNGALMLDYKSCEMMARDLFDYLQSQSKYRRGDQSEQSCRSVTITVSEDGENGGTIRGSL